MTVKRANFSYDTGGATYYPSKGNGFPQVACGLRASVDLSVDSITGDVTVHRSELNRYGSTTRGSTRIIAYYDLEKKRSASSLTIHDTDDEGWGTKSNHGLRFQNLSEPIAFVEIEVSASYGNNPYYSLFYMGTGQIIGGMIGSITLNERPSVPLVVSPNGGESINTLHTIRWNPATDPDNEQSSLRYHVQLSTNNGQTWKDIVALTPAGAVSYEYNFINEPTTGTAKVRIRSFDGTSYSAWDESNGVFTIKHNVAPTTPTQLSPSGVIVDRTKTQRLSWKHNDADDQSKADIEWRSQGSSVWNTITSSGSEQSYFIPANSFPAGQIEWRVRTYDQESLVSPYSAIAVFSSAEPTNAPEIIAPTSPVAVSRPVVQWIGGAQASYQIIIEDALGEVVWDTGEIASGVKARTIGIDLLNGGTYTIKLRVKDGSGLFSSFVEKTVVVSYTPPAKPEVSAYKEKAGVRFAIDNPNPTGTQPNVTENELYKLIGNEWVRIAVNLVSTYTDYALASEEVAKYRIHALGENGTFSESDVLDITAPKLRGVYLHDVQDPEMSIHQFRIDGGGRGDSLQREHAFRQFAGRKRPVIEYGMASTYQVSAPIELLRDNIGRERLVQFVNDGAILLYRDGRGRKFYTTLPNLSMDDVFYGNSLKLDLMAIDYREEV